MAVEAELSSLKRHHTVCITEYRHTRSHLDVEQSRMDISRDRLKAARTAHASKVQARQQMVNDLVEHAHTNGQLMVVAMEKIREREQCQKAVDVAVSELEVYDSTLTAIHAIGTI